MDLSGVPPEKLRVVVEPDRVYVYADGQPPLVMTHEQVQGIWTSALLGRAREPSTPWPAIPPKGEAQAEDPWHGFPPEAAGGGG